MSGKNKSSHVKKKGNKAAPMAKKTPPAKKSHAARVVLHPFFGENMASGLSLPRRSSPSGAPPNGLFYDPFASVSSDSMELKCDCSDLVIEASLCTTEDKYSSQTTQAKSLFRMAWAPPLAEITTAGDEPKVDQRGLLTEIQSCHISFTNMTDDIIKIRANCPRAMISDSTLVGTRDCNLSTDLGPMKTVKVTVKLGEISPFFCPLAYNVEDGNRLKLAVVALLDFLVIVPNISLDTGSSYNGNRAICKVHFETKYMVNTDPREGTSSVYRLPYRLQNLTTLSDLFKVDGILIKSQVRTLGDYIKPQIVVPELTSEKWMRMELYKRSGMYSYAYRLVFCDVKGNYHSKVQFREFQGSDYRLMALGSRSNFVRHFPGTADPDALTGGTGVLKWDEDEEAWVMCSARGAVTADIANPGSDASDNLIPATSPFIVFSVSPPRQDLVSFVRGGQLLTVRHPDEIEGIVSDVIAVIDAATNILASFRTVLAIFA